MSKLLNPRDNFSDSLKRGRQGESAFLYLWRKHYPDVPIRRLSGRSEDFYLPDSGYSIEVKSDYTRSPNFFFEHTRNTKTGKPGGPFQSREKGITIFAYFFSKTGQVHYFRVDELCDWLEQHAHELPTASVPSHDDKGNEWQNFGLIVSKGLIADLCFEPVNALEEPFKIIISTGD